MKAKSKHAARTSVAHGVAAACGLPRARRRDQEGAVMLVVMLILLVATASAAVATRATQTELRAAGNQRQAVQTRQLSDIALATTLTWYDKVFGQAPVDFRDYWLTCSQNASAIPTVNEYGQPAYDLGDACRLHWRIMAELDPLDSSLDEVAPLSQFEQTQPAPAPPPGPTNVTGSFGPRQAYMPQDDFIVDLNCREWGTEGAGTRYYCVLTSHSRTWLPGYDVTDGGTVFRAWTVGADTYNQNPYGTYHQSRAAVLTSAIEGG